MTRVRLVRGLIGLGTSLAAVAAALVLSMVVILAFGKSPSAAIDGLYQGSLGGRLQIGATISRMVPLALVALGWIVAFSAGRINIGLAGQIIAGGIVATVLGVNFADLPAAVHLPLAVIGGMMGGAAWAGIAAWLWARFEVNEIISTLLLNLVAVQVLGWVVSGPLEEPTGSFPRSEHITDTASWPNLLSRTPLSWDVVLTIVIVFIVALLPRTTFGTRLRLTGANAEAALYAGVGIRRVGVAALVLSGSLGGLAGSSLILAGDVKSLSDGFQAEFGFEGIVVALVARNDPIAVIPVAFGLAALQQGGGTMQVVAGVPSAVVLITYGLVVLFVAGSTVLLARLFDRFGHIPEPKAVKRAVTTAASTS